MGSWWLVDLRTAVNLSVVARLTYMPAMLFVSGLARELCSPSPMFAVFALLDRTVKQMTRYENFLLLSDG